MEDIYTDLASEFLARVKNKRKTSVKSENINGKHITIKSFEINTDVDSKALSRPRGRYVVIEAEDFKDALSEELSAAIRSELIKLIRYSGFCDVPDCILLVGLGNREITSDSIGPRVIDNINITGHIKRLFPEYAASHKSVFAIAPGVMAQTGMETADIVKGIVDVIGPDLIVCIDALASQSMNRICTTIQLTSCGIAPGSGIGNLRNAINKETMGVPVVTIGIPTVVGALTMVRDYLELLSREELADINLDKLGKSEMDDQLRDKYVTTKNIDEEVSCLAKQVGIAINETFLQGKDA